MLERSLKKIRTIYSCDYWVCYPFYKVIFIIFFKTNSIKTFFPKIDLCTFLGSRKVESAPRNQRSALHPFCITKISQVDDQWGLHFAKKICQEMAPHVSMTNQSLSNAEELRSRILCNCWQKSSANSVKWNESEVSYPMRY